MNYHNKANRSNYSSSSFKSLAVPPPQSNNNNNNNNTTTKSNHFVDDYARITRINSIDKNSNLDFNNYPSLQADKQQHEHEYRQQHEQHQQHHHHQQCEQLNHQQHQQHENHYQEHQENEHEQNYTSQILLSNLQTQSLNVSSNINHSNTLNTAANSYIDTHTTSTAINTNSSQFSTCQSSHHTFPSFTLRRQSQVSQLSPPTGLYNTLYSHSTLPSTNKNDISSSFTNNRSLNHHHNSSKSIYPNNESYDGIDVTDSASNYDERIDRVSAVDSLERLLFKVNQIVGENEEENPDTNSSHLITNNQFVNDVSNENEKNELLLLQKVDFVLGTKTKMVDEAQQTSFINFKNETCIERQDWKGLSKDSTRMGVFGSVSGSNSRETRKLGQNETQNVTSSRKGMIYHSTVAPIKKESIIMPTQSTNPRKNRVLCLPKIEYQTMVNDEDSFLEVTPPFCLFILLKLS